MDKSAVKQKIFMWFAKKIYPYMRQIYYENEINNWTALIPDKLSLASSAKLIGTPFFSIDDGSLIEIGENTVILSDDKINTSAGLTASYFVVYNNARITIGNNVGISNSALTARKEIVIEDDVAIGSGCMIADNDFHSIRLEERLSCPDPNIKTKPIVIKRGAFIGARTIILKGVTIGEEAVIGAGSVVTCDIPPREIWAGNPASFKSQLL